MKFRKTTLALAVPAALCLINSSAYAADPSDSPSQIDPVVISAARIGQPLSDVLPSVTVITKEEIQKSQGRSIFDILQGQPGIEIGQNGGLGATASIFMRGENSVSVAIFVDGIRVQPDAYSSLSNTSFPPLQSIERIEILRGNASSMYGEAAIGGVINIYTNAASNGAPKPYATVTVGSHDTIDASGGVSGRSDNTKYNVSANATSSDGFPSVNNTIYPTASHSTGGYNGKGVNLGLSQLVNGDAEIGVKARYQDNQYKYNDTNSYGDYINQVVNMQTTNTDATLFAKGQLTSLWHSQVDATSSNLNYDYSPEGSLPSSAPSNAHSDTTALNWNNNYTLGGMQQLNFGVAYSKQRYDDSSGDLMYRDNLGFFAGDNITWDRFDFQVNLRHDQVKVNQPNAVTNGDSTVNDQTFDANTGLFGVGYRLTDNFRLTAAASSGFRAPSVGEFFPGPFCGASFASSCFNPNLKPEVHHTQEGGFEYKNDYSLTRVVFFNTRTNDAISYYGAPNEGYINIPTLANHGIEISERASWEGYNLTGSYTHQNPADESTSTPLYRRAKDFGSLDLNKVLGKYDVGIKVTYSGSRNDYDWVNLQPKTLSSYTVWSFYAGYRIDDQWSVRARLENAFNENYELAYGFNTPGRTAWLTLNYQPK